MNRLYNGRQKKVYVIGDLHGDYSSFSKSLRILPQLNESSLMIFLGDYADRGTHGTDIIDELNDLLQGSSQVVALKGNHEMYSGGRPVFSPCDLVYEVEQKYGSWKEYYKDVYTPFLDRLCVAAIVNNVLFVHGGISSRIHNEDDLTLPENEQDLLWSDPSEYRGETANLRGVGVAFGEDLTSSVLSSLGLKMIIRSHEPAKAAAGPFVEHGGMVMTINSCNSYGKAWKPFMLSIDSISLHYQTIYLQ